MAPQKIRKAVIPAAGFGIRFLPATKAMPKEMLPIIDKPIIHFVVEEAVAAGIEDIIIITGRGKRAIEDHFDYSPELEHHLSKKGNESELKILKNMSNLADLHYIRQKEPLGLGHAVLCAEKHIGNDPFAVLLGDDIIVSKKPAIGQLIEDFNKTGSSVLGVEKVPQENVSRYGIIDIESRNSLIKVRDLVEKPKKEDAPSNLGIIGRYVLTPEIFSCIKRTKPGVGGEIQLTDALRLLLKEQKIYAKEIEGTRYDVGCKRDYVKATIDFALMREDLRDAVKEHVKRNCCGV